MQNVRLGLADLLALRMHVGASSTTRSTAWRVIGVLVSLSVAIGLLWRLLSKEKLVQAVHALAQVSPIILLAFPLFIAWNLLAVFGWRTVLCALRPETKGGVFWMLISRLSAQSVNAVVPSGGLAGEVLRSAALMRLGVPLPVAGTATLVDNVSGVVGGLVFSIIVVLLESWNLPKVRTASNVALLLVGVALAVTLFTLPRWLANRIARYRFARESDVNGTLLPLMQTRGFAHAVLRGIGWRMAERLLTAGEIWLGFWALGRPVYLLDACLVVAAMVVTSFVFFLIPAQLGAVEWAIVVVAGLFGVGPSLALGVALLRRSRQLVTSLAGLSLVFWVTQSVRIPRAVCSKDAAAPLIVTKSTIAEGPL